MSKKNRQPHQLSEQEVYRDAAKILEEVLEARLGRKSLKSNGSTITGTGTSSSSGYYDASRESLDIWLKDDASSTYDFNIARSHTMPSSFKLEEKDEFTEEDIREYMKRKSDFANRRHSGSATSGESDALDTRVGAPLRRKKSFMRRAKERLSISFRRQDRERENDGDKDKDKTKKKERKKKKKNDKDKSSSQVNGGEDEFNEEVELRHGGNRNRSDSTASKRNSFLDSFRRSFRSKRKSSSTIFESQSADPVIGRRDKDEPINGKEKDIPKPASTVPDKPAKDKDIKENVVVPPIPKPYFNSVEAIDLDDIKYIDDDNTDQNKNKKGDLPKPSRSRSKPAPPPPSAPPIHHPNNLILEGTIANNTTNDSESDASTSNWEEDDKVDSPDKKEKMDDKTDEKAEDKSKDDIPFHERSDTEKEDLFEKIAAKLMDMADHIDKSKISSDTDGGVVKHFPKDHSSSVDPEHLAGEPEQLTALELEILDCLRVGGDRLSQSFDDPVQVVIEQHRKQAYSRFYDTLRKGLGDEISWNQLSLIYHTASGAVKAAGAGSQLAFRVKDMTQQYVGDIFASWIVKEGGWDSMLSESESEVTN